MFLSLPSPTVPGSIPLLRNFHSNTLRGIENVKSFLEYPVYIFFNPTFVAIFIPLSCRSISGTQVLVFIFYLKLV